ncbi:MAG: alanine--tRNA ligase, partial [Patescibacteria group bacterium]
EGGIRAKDLKREDFDKEFEKHQEISRAGVEKKFGGHGLTLDTGELKAGSEEEQKKVIRFHTATHLLHQALRDVLGNEVEQRGSDITPERTRFDFAFPRKVTPEELKRVQEIVNEKIKADLPVRVIEMSKENAEKTGALRFFNGKYGDRVTVYFIGDSLENAFNKEFCAGPHVSHTGEIGKFKITKEESSSAGIRRIRAVIQ